MPGGRLVWIGLALCSLLALPARAADPAAPSPIPWVVGETEVVVRVGEELRLELRDPGGQAAAWALESGPPGLALAQDGLLVYRPTVADVGRWQVQVRIWVDGAWATRASMDLVVQARSTDPGVVGSPRSYADLAVELGESVGRPRRPLPARVCALQVGLAGGVASTRRSWEFVGDTIQVSGSPLLGASCDGGASRGAWWSFGVDAAPGVSYILDDQRVRHGFSTLLAAGWTNGIWYVGGYGTAGATVLGLGPTLRWTPLTRPSGARHGPAVRVTWMAAGIPVFEAALSWHFDLAARADGPARKQDDPEP